MEGEPATVRDAVPVRSTLMKSVDSIFDFLASLKLAVLTIVGLAAALATATILESQYDTATAQYHVYRSFWFFALLALLGINIIFVALSRWPWKRRHIPFLLAHLGITILLGGSLATYLYGLDGSLRLSEGESSGTIETGEHQLLVSEQGADQAFSFIIPWIPPHVAFKPFSVQSRPADPVLAIVDYISRAEPIFSFAPNPNGPLVAGAPKRAAIEFEFRAMPGAPPMMKQLLQARGGQAYWLWRGDAAWSTMQAGPAKVLLLDAESAVVYKQSGETMKSPTGADIKPPTLVFYWKGDALRFRSFSSEGRMLEGEAPVGRALTTGWKGVEVEVKKAIADAIPDTRYVPAKIQYGPSVAPPALRLAIKGHESLSVWLGLGDQTILDGGGKRLQIGFFSKRVVLPFALSLERFNIERYQGSYDPSSFASRVKLQDAGKDASGPEGEITISMNEPLTHRGITFYQASYEDASPRPVTSILSVNRDPGRVWKYLGSLLIVLGSVLLFARRYAWLAPWLK